MIGWIRTLSVLFFETRVQKAWWGQILSWLVGPPETLSPIEKEIDLLNSRLDPFASLERIWPTQSRRNE
jgi:hypothetical protein